MEDAVWFLLVVQVILNLFLVGNVLSIRKRFENWPHNPLDRVIIDISGACEELIRLTASQLGIIKEIKENTRKIQHKTDTVRTLDDVHLDLQSILHDVSGIRLYGPIGLEETLDRIQSDLMDIKIALEK
jgi:hypothetical protein